MADKEGKYLTFSLAGEEYGIGILKVKEIIGMMPITVVPQTPAYIKGVINLRGKVIPVIDLAKFLGFAPSPNPKADKYIVAEFNQGKYAFHVHTVSRIHRISWQQIEKPSDIIQSEQSSVIGIVKINDRMILLLDFEKIMVDIAPSLSNQSAAVKAMGERPVSSKRIVIAEDSPMLRKLLQEYLPQIGYPNLTFFSDGQQALEYLLGIAEKFGEK